MKRSRIIGTGSYLPERVLTNADLEKMVETSDQWITERTGIKTRHLAADGEPAQLTASLGEPRQVDFDDAASRRRERLEQFAAEVEIQQFEIARRGTC